MIQIHLKISDSLFLCTIVCSILASDTKFKSVCMFKNDVFEKQQPSTIKSQFELRKETLNFDIRNYFVISTI